MTAKVKPADESASNVDVVAEILRLGRREDQALSVAIAAMVLVVLSALLVQFGVPVELAAPVIGILCVVGILAAGVWALASVRTSRALNRVAPDMRPGRRPVMFYVFLFGFAASVGVAYWFANRPIRELLWGAWSLAGIAAFFWIQGRHRH